MGNALFVVWRESLEAMLVIGILHAWIGRNRIEGGFRALYAGVGAGILLALLLGWAMLAAQSELSGLALEWFQTGVLFAAAVLIAQMVLWMARHGREMKQQLEAGMARAAGRGQWFGMAAIAALAVAREGAETVIFLYGLSMEGGGMAALAGGAAGGFLLALATAWAAARGLRGINMRHFFTLSGILLLVFAAALFAAGIERLIGMGVLPALIDPLWDSSALLDDSSSGGRFVAGLTGYRAQPSLMLLLCYAAFWLCVGGLRQAMARTSRE